MKRLIVNADDFGYTRGVNRAIVEAHRTGIVTSASLLANGPAFADAVAQFAEEPGLDVGCHLNFVEGVPVSAPDRIPHLVRADGGFHTAAKLAWLLVRGAIPVEELETEAAAQVEKLLAAGLLPSHLDTHQHTHLHPRVAVAVARVAQRFGIGWIRRPFEVSPPANGTRHSLRGWASRLLNRLAPSFERRMAAHGLQMTDFFTGFAQTGKLTKEALEATLLALPPGVTELMCHPGYCDREIESAPTRLKQQREDEFRVLADASWRPRLEALGVRLTQFRLLSAAARSGEERPRVVGAPARGRQQGKGNAR